MWRMMLNVFHRVCSVYDNTIDANIMLKAELSIHERFEKYDYMPPCEFIQYYSAS